MKFSILASAFAVLPMAFSKDGQVYSDGNLRKQPFVEKKESLANNDKFVGTLLSSTGILESMVPQLEKVVDGLCDEAVGDIRITIGEKGLVHYCSTAATGIIQSMLGGMVSEAMVKAEFSNNLKSNEGWIPAAIILIPVIIDIVSGEADLALEMKESLAANDKGVGKLLSSTGILKSMVPQLEKVVDGLCDEAVGDIKITIGENGLVHYCSAAATGIIQSMLGGMVAEAMAKAEFSNNLKSNEGWFTLIPKLAPVIIRLVVGSDAEVVTQAA